jgi:uncharacterized protein (TIGR03663 family)
MRVALPRRLREDRVLAGVLAATALALLARLWALGYRTAHQDEGRVAVNILDYVASGVWEYRPIVHGPFLFQVNGALFGVVEPTDFSARLVVALAGGLLPLVALLVRQRLDGAETVALAALLAANPILLYYSRFMRNDVLVGAFSLAALGFFLRAYDTDTPRLLYPGVAFLALALTTKENAIVYVGTWVGAAALVADHRLRMAPPRGEDYIEVIDAGVDRALGALGRWGPTAALAAVEALVILVFFYAPRPAFRRMFGDPAMVPGVVLDATVGSWQAFWGTWVSGGHQDHPYIPYLTDYLDVLFAGGLVVVGFGVGGFMLDRYARGARPLVQFASYWGVATVVLAPLTADISPIPWMGVHAVLPLAVPAAVALAAVYEQGRVGFAYDDRVRVALAAVVLVLAAGHVGLTAVETSYQRPQDPGALVQYGQPDSDVKPALRTIRPIVEGNAGTDVAFYSTHFQTRMFRMPFPWYLGAMGADVTATGDATDLAEDPPPIVVAPSDDSAGIDQTAQDVRPALDGYTRLGKYAIVLEIPGNEVYAEVYVDSEALAAVEAN